MGVHLIIVPYALRGVQSSSSKLKLERSSFQPDWLIALKRTAVQLQSMKLTSPSFEDGGEIPEKYGYMHENVNPELRIENVPENAETLALVFQDPDAQEMAGKTWLHWLVWNIPADTERIEEGSSLGVEGTTDFKETGYNGANPPEKEHELVFTLYALSDKLGLNEGASLEEFEEAIDGKVVEETHLKVTHPHEHVTRE